MNIKVLHVLEAIEGGVARHMVNLVRHVDAQHVVVAPPERIGGVTDNAAFAAMRRAGAQVELLDMRRLPIHPRTIAAVPLVQRVARRVRPDIIHGHSAIGGAVARLAAVGTDAACVYTPHGLFPSRGAYAMERALGRLTDRMIAASPSEAFVAREQRLVEPGRLVVIPNAVDLAAPAPAAIDVRAALGIGANTPIVGTVARLAAQKAPEVFIRACAIIARAVPDARFVLVGDGPLAPQVRAEIAANEFGHRFLLLRDRPDGEALIAQFDVFVLSSRYEAGAPFAAMEAMRVGTPVVVTDVVGNRDTIEHERSGLLVPRDDPSALAGAVVRLLQDDLLRQRLGDEAKERIAAEFEVCRWAAALTHLYRALTFERAHARGAVDLRRAIAAPVPHDMAPFQSRANPEGSV